MIVALFQGTVPAVVEPAQVPVPYSWSVIGGMFLVGITGGIGAGKSQALCEFQTFGVRVLDADAVVHELYGTDSGLRAALLERWGLAVLGADGQVDRAAVARRVFGAATEREWLNQQVHPLVKRRILQDAEESSSGLFCAIPLLFEVQWEPAMTCTVAVWCDPQSQRKRLRGRGWSDPEIAQRTASQMSMDEKLARADFGILNIGSLRLLRVQCRQVFERIMEYHGPGREAHRG